MPEDTKTTWTEYFYTSANGSGYVYASSYEKNGNTVSFMRDDRVVLVVKNVLLVEAPKS